MRALPPRNCTCTSTSFSTRSFLWTSPQGNGTYTSCCFLPGTTQAITVTSTGEVRHTMKMFPSLRVKQYTLKIISEVPPCLVLPFVQRYMAVCSRKAVLLYVSSISLPRSSDEPLQHVQVVLWDEVQTVERGNGAGSMVDRDIAAETAQLLLHRPKRQAVKVCLSLPCNVVSTTMTIPYVATVWHRQYSVIAGYIRYKQSLHDNARKSVLLVILV